MSWVGTARLTGVLLILLGVLWIGERRPTRPASEPAPLLAVPPAGIARIELADGSGRLTAVRSNGGWTDPNGSRWRSDAPDDLLAALATVRPTPLDEAGDTSIHEYGLDGADAMQLALRNAAGDAVLALTIGRRNPAWTGRYARRAADPRILLVGGLLEWELEKLRESSPAR